MSSAFLGQMKHLKAYYLGEKIEKFMIDGGRGTRENTRCSFGSNSKLPQASNHDKIRCSRSNYL